MSELLAAAKAVIEAADTGDRWCAIANLSAAVERAEKQEAVGFDEWFPTSGWNPECVEYILEVWQAAQHAERERIKKIVEAVGVQGEHDQWFDACDTIMEKIDER